METSALLILLSAGLCTSAFLGHYKQNLKAISTPTNWTDAQTYCREKHTDLVTVRTQEEAERAQNVTPEFLLWIGLRRRQGDTKWSNGDIVHYDNRSKGDGRAPPYCHSMSASGRWENVDCTDNKTFVCYDEDSPPNYTLIEQKRSWCDAQQYCRVHHTDLVSINSSSQNTEVLELGLRKDSFWIGLMSTDWEWSDGGCSSFRNWDIESRAEQEKDCVIILKSPDAKMTRQNCDLGGTGICYEDEVHLVRQPKTWEDALDHCDREYGGLLRVESAQDQGIVEAALKRSNVSGPVWLGLRQSRLFGFWIWPNGANVEWSNWEGGSQPEKPLSHICGAIATSGPGTFKWSDRDCLSKSYFLCEGEERQAV